jgi:hypothetical protein
LTLLLKTLVGKTAADFAIRNLLIVTILSTAAARLPGEVGARTSNSGLRGKLLEEGGKIYFVGDSLTAGEESFPELIQIVISSSFPEARIAVVKHGLSGAKMTRLTEFATEDLQGVHSDAIVVFVQDAGLTDHPLPVWEEAVKSITRVAGKRKVFLLNEGRGPSWKPGSSILEGLNEEQWNVYWRKDINPALFRISEETGAQLVDYEKTLHHFFTLNPNADIMHPDGVHLGKGGKLLMALVCLRSLGFAGKELNLRAIPLKDDLIQSILQAVFVVTDAAFIK